MQGKSGHKVKQTKNNLSRYFLLSMIYIATLSIIIIFPTTSPKETSPITVTEEFLKSASKELFNASEIIKCVDEKTKMGSEIKNAKDDFENAGIIKRLSWYLGIQKPEIIALTKEVNLNPNC